MDKTQLVQTQWFISFEGLCTQIVWTTLEFQFTTTTGMSMDTKSSILDDQISGANFQIEGHTPTSPSGQKGLKEIGASGSAPSHSPSQSPERWLLPGCPKTWYWNTCNFNQRGRSCTSATPCLDGTSGGGHATTQQDWPHQSSSDGPGRAVLFYGRWSLGEGLSLGKARDATFTLTGAGTWVGKLAHLAANPLTIWEGQWVITQAITKCWIGARGPGHPCSHLTTPQPFRFYCGDESFQEKCIKDATFDHWPPLHKPLWGRDHEQQQSNPRPVLPQSPPPSPDHGFESHRSSVSTASSVSLQSDRSEDSQHPHHGRHHRESKGHMKINLPIFKDEDTKDTVTYQSWRWDLTVYHWAGFWDCTLLPYTIWSLQGYPRQLWGALGWT